MTTARAAKINTVKDKETLSEMLPDDVLVNALRKRAKTRLFTEEKQLDETIRRKDEEIALTRRDKKPLREAKTGLQYKFQGSSATVTYSRS